MLEQLHTAAEQFNYRPEPKSTGRLTRVVGLTIEAVGLRVAVGSRCLIEHPEHSPVEAEVVGFCEDKAYLVALCGQQHLYPGSRVRPLEHSGKFRCDDALLGRVVDALADPLDGLGELSTERVIKFASSPVNPMQRQLICEPLDVGVRSINALLTLGRGQRIGLFAGSGVGKSTLLGMISRYTSADVVVVGLIGERGREVREFIDQNMREEMRQKAIVVASPADDTALKRVRAANLATRIAEDFRDRGKHVLLLMDSLSRFAQAHREIALAAGEPPATRGYPASVLAKLPALVERAGNGVNPEGSLTAIYTVLTDGDELQDPVADASRAILDGHIVLSRSLADAGHFPAIDVGASISRVMTSVVNEQHGALAIRCKQWLAAYEEVRDLLSIGAYREGSDELSDTAVKKWPQIRQFLQQNVTERCPIEESVSALQQLISGASSAPQEASPSVPQSQALSVAENG